MAKASFSFAHLLGLGASASEDEEDKKAKKARGRRAEENKDTDPDAEDEDTEPDTEDEDTEPDAEDEDTEPDAEDEEPDPDAEDDDGDDENAGKATRKARSVERRRCARIFGSQYAAANPALAASLAFNTGMSSASAISIMKSAAAAPAPVRGTGGRRSLDERMMSGPQVRLGVDGGKSSSGKSALVSKMMQLYNNANARGEK
ncbi:hypothetical protein ACQYRI_08870 [Salmonella enterica]